MEEETWREGAIERMADGGRDMERGSNREDERWRKRHGERE